MEIWKIKVIFREKNEFITLNELYDEFSERYDVSQYVDYKAAIRCEVNRNCIDRNRNKKHNSIFISLFPKGTKGQKYGLYDWVKQDTEEETDVLIDNIQKNPKIYFLKNMIRIARDNSVKNKVLERAKCLCEVDTNHRTFIRKKDGSNYTEVHHLIPLELQFSNKFKNISLDCPANAVSLCSNCHNQLHYGLDNKEILYTLYLKRKNELESSGINISFEELLLFYN